MRQSQKKLVQNGGASGGGARAQLSRPFRTPRLPQNDIEFLEVSHHAAHQWLKTPEITLLWSDPAIFHAKTQALEKVLRGRQASGKQRTTHLQLLKNLDAAMEKGIRKLKLYLLQKYGKLQAYVQYPRYALIKRRGHYTLPDDRKERLSAIARILAALEKDGFAHEPYGHAFWNKIKEDYQQALPLYSDTGAANEDIVDKQLLKEELTEIMESLQLVIRANYPHTYEAQFRTWGWQKETG